jgi:hypothetical protein
MILIDIGHPAHVHFFKNYIKEHQDGVIVTARQKEVTLYLLEKYGIDYINLGENKKGTFKKALNLPKVCYKLAQVCKKNNPSFMMAIGSPYISLVGKAMRTRSVVFTDSEPVKIDRYLVYPFATEIHTPVFFRKEVPRQYRYKGCHELAYLHPNYFKHKQNKSDYVLLRFVSWGASHDKGMYGFPDFYKEKLVEIIKERGYNPIISSEGVLPRSLEKYRITSDYESMHEILNNAAMVVCDSQTMATESAILGVPTIRSNSFVGPNDMGIFIDLENKYGLLKNISSPEEATILANHWLKNLATIQKGIWESKERFISEHIDVNQYIKNVVGYNMMKAYGVARKK